MCIFKILPIAGLCIAYHGFPQWKGNDYTDYTEFGTELRYEMLPTNRLMTHPFNRWLSQYIQLFPVQNDQKQNGVMKF